MSGGSHQTGIATAEHMTKEFYAVISDPFNCGGGRRCGIREEDKDCSSIEADTIYPWLWLQPAYVAEASSRMVRRSVELFEEAPTLGLNYGENISILIRDANRDKEVAASLLQMFPPPLLPEKASMRVVSGKNAVKLGEAPPAGHGPPAETRAFSGSESYAVAQGENGKWAHIHYTSPDAYEVAAIASVAGALTLVEEIDDIQPRGGIISPAYAFHGTSFVD